MKIIDVYIIEHEDLGLIYFDDFHDAKKVTDETRIKHREIIIHENCEEYLDWAHRKLLRISGLKKLTDEEKEALGIKDNE